MKLSREGLIIIFFGSLAIIAFARSFIALTLLTGLVFLSIPIIALIWSFFATRSAEIRREHPDEGVAGEQLFTTYRLTSHSLFPSYGVKFRDNATRGYITGLDMTASTGLTLRQSISSLGKFMGYFGVTLLEEVDLFHESFHKVGLKADFPVYFPPLIRGVWFTRSIPLTFPVRGKYRIGPGEVESGDPLGIFKMVVKTQGFSEILILPTWTSLRFFPTGGSSRILRDENIPRDREGASPEFLGVREYRQGDPLKFVHWKLSAKHNELMVKQFVQQVESSWGILVDLRKGYNAGQGRETSLEYMIEIVAAILEQFDDEKIPHILVLAADDISVTESLKGERMFDTELRILAASRNDGSLPLANRAFSFSEKYPSLSWVLITPRKDTDILDTVQALSHYGGNVLVTNVDFNTFLTEDFPPEMLAKWRRTWGADMEGFDQACIAAGARMFDVKRGDDLSLVFFS